ncbi:hypothetical protein BDF19DRAFT_451987 [Syncephalis fuscata]|nr:hypothetical protein BDF19DRAFT_451987 [Syncephalis fuscata]
MTTTTLDSAVDYEIQGIDTAEPILRIGIHYFKGTWDLMVGTDLIFAPTSENKQPQETAPHAQLVAKSTKILRCQLMQLQPHPV